MQLSKHFNTDEFTCHCGCGLCGPNPLLIVSLETLRARLNNIKPHTTLTINSGTRCKKHNRVIEGAKQSMHVPHITTTGLYSLAADVSSNNFTPREIYNEAIKIYAFEHGGIGLYPSWIHLDVRGYKARW